MKEFLQKEIAGLPNWVWLIVIAGGIAAVYIIPKFTKKSTTATTADTATNTGTGAAGIGLAIDPTTGLPYAVEGLVPSGGMGATGSDLSSTNALLAQMLTNQQQELTLLNMPATPTIQGTIIPPGPSGGVNPPTATAPAPTATATAPAPTATAPAPPQAPTPPAPAPTTRYYTVVPGDTLWSIAARYLGSGSNWPSLYNANKATIGSNPNLIYPGQRFVLP